MTNSGGPSPDRAGSAPSVTTVRTESARAVAATKEAMIAPCECPTRSTSAAPVSARTRSISAASCGADAPVSESSPPAAPSPGSAPTVGAHTQNPSAASAAPKLAHALPPLSPVPWTRITGSGRSAVGRQSSRLRPGGSARPCVSWWTAPSHQRHGTPAAVGAAVEVAGAAGAAKAVGTAEAVGAAVEVAGEVATTTRAATATARRSVICSLSHGQ